MSTPATVPIIDPTGKAWDIPRDKAPAALQAGGKLGVNVTGPDNSNWLIPSDRVKDAIAQGGKLMGAPPSLPQPQMESSLADQLATRAVDAGKTVGDAVQSVAKPVIGASAPNIALQLYKHLRGEPNTLKEIPGDAVATWMMAGGLEGAMEGGAGRAAGAEATAAAKPQPSPVRQPPPLPEAFQSAPSPYRPPAGTVDNPLQVPGPARTPPPLPEAFNPAPPKIQPPPGMVDNPFRSPAPPSPAPAPPPSAGPVPPSLPGGPASFPPRGPVSKFQYDPARWPSGSPLPHADFEITPGMSDHAEDQAIEDGMRADLGKHGTIANIQANREFAARNSMDTPKGVLQDRAANSAAGGKLLDAAVKDIGSPADPVEFLSGDKAFKNSGEWFLKRGDQWVHVQPDEMRGVIHGQPKLATAANPTSASPARTNPPGSQDLTEEWQQNLDYLKKKKGSH